MGEFKVSKQVLCDFLITNSTKDRGALFSYIKFNYNIEDDNLKAVEDKLTQFMSIFEQKWKNAFYNVKTFRARNTEWLLSDFSVQFSGIRTGRRHSDDFDNSSKSTKRRKLLKLRESYSESEIQCAFLSILRSSGRNKIANDISKLLLIDDDDDHNSSGSRIGGVIRYTDEEALALIEDAKLSVYQYEIIRVQAKDKNANIYPHYRSLANARTKCYPPESDFVITEESVSINTQALLDHTVSRLLEIPGVVPPNLVDKPDTAMILTSKYGCDGTSGHNPYNQSFTDPSKSDASVLIFSMVPLSLEILDPESDKNLTIWKNPHPGSPRLCRIMRFRYVKETKENTISEVKMIQKEIEDLKPTTIKLGLGRSRCKVSHKMIMSMVDGKVCQALTETPSSSSCYICGAKPSMMNKLEEIKLLPVKIENFSFGLSTLHAWIRFMECILHIAYRLEFCKWAAILPDHKQKMGETKRIIQKEFWVQLGLIVDVPQQGSGTSNNGNTARRFFQDPELTSNITGVDKDLIQRFGIILQAMACGKEVDIIKFGKYCQDTAKLYVSLYEWYKMPVTVHKILIHGAEVIEAVSLSIGQLTEEAQEANNKIFKRIREFNTRKISRIATNEDLCHKLLIMTDPYINHHRTLRENLIHPMKAEARDLLIEDDQKQIE